MRQLQAGFARADVTPMMGIGISGYYVPRNARRVLDALEVCALALACGEERAVLLSIDNCGLAPTSTFDACRQRVAEALGLPVAAVLIACTHTHTSPFWDESSEDALVREYSQLLSHRLVDAARFAFEDLRPARMGYAVGNAPHVAFVRRFRMRDGSIQTNPGVGNPDIVEPIGEVDERVNVLRLDREGGDTLVLVNFGNHPDVVGGENISADWPGLARRAVERALPGSRCIFFNGAQGDVNHVNVHPQGGDMNDLAPDFDDVARGYGHARHIGNVIAGAVMQIYDKAAYVPVDSLRYAARSVRVASNLPRSEDLPQARRYAQLHREGRDDEIPFRGMQLTTVVAEAERMLRLEHGPAAFELELGAVAIGDVALFGIPGEPFTGIGRALKEAPGWALVLPMCITNGYEGYFPTREAYDEGGYEARSSVYAAGVAETISAEGLMLLKELEQRKDKDTP